MPRQDGRAKEGRARRGQWTRGRGADIIYCASPGLARWNNCISEVMEFWGKIVWGIYMIVASPTQRGYLLDVLDGDGGARVDRTRVIIVIITGS